MSGWGAAHTSTHEIGARSLPGRGTKGTLLLGHSSCSAPVDIPVDWVWKWTGLDQSGMSNSQDEVQARPGQVVATTPNSSHESWSWKLARLG